MIPEFMKFLLKIEHGFSIMHKLCDETGCDPKTVCMVLQSCIDKYSDMDEAVSACKQVCTSIVLEDRGKTLSEELFRLFRIIIQDIEMEEMYSAYNALYADEYKVERPAEWHYKHRTHVKTNTAGYCTRKTFRRGKTTLRRH